MLPATIIERLLLPESPPQEASFYFGLEAYLRQHLPEYRDYLFFWQTEPTIMLGKYQELYAEVDVQAMREAGIVPVRRPSGGGCIYTDHGSLQFSQLSRLRTEGQGMQDFAAAVFSACRSLGLAAEFSGRNDLLLDGRKFSGNAQYRQGGVVIHHGSILLDTDLSRLVSLLRVPEIKLESKGIRSIRSRVTNLYDTQRFPLSAFYREIRRAYEAQGYRWQERDLSAQEFQGALRESSAFCPELAYTGLSLASMITQTGRFSCGTVELKLEIRQGEIRDCSLTGDFFASGEPSEISRALQGVLYRQSAVLERLQSVPVAAIIPGLSAEELARLIPDV